jgi:hypothetical protein
LFDVIVASAFAPQTLDLRLEFEDTSFKLVRVLVGPHVPLANTLRSLKLSYVARAVTCIALMKNFKRGRIRCEHPARKLTALGQ